MKHLLLTTIAAVVLVGCGESQSPEPPTVEAPDISIYEAAEDGNIEAVKQHLAAGADVNAKTDTGWIPLHRAAYWGHKEVAELLIANGAEVNTKNENGWTPLHYAAVVDHKEIVELLLASGADVNAKTDAGETPLDNAIKYKRTETADLLRKHGGKTGYEDIYEEFDLDDHDDGGKTGAELKAEEK
jgi:ankyrin repeat protein